MHSTSVSISARQYITDDQIHSQNCVGLIRKWWQNTAQNGKGCQTDKPPALFVVLSSLLLWLALGYSSSSLRASQKRVAMAGAAFSLHAAGGKRRWGGEAATAPPLSTSLVPTKHQVGRDLEPTSFPSLPWSSPCSFFPLYHSCFKWTEVLCSQHTLLLFIQGWYRRGGCMLSSREGKKRGKFFPSWSMEEYGLSCFVHWADRHPADAKKMGWIWVEGRHRLPLPETL